MPSKNKTSKLQRLKSFFSSIFPKSNQQALTTPTVMPNPIYEQILDGNAEPTYAIIIPDYASTADITDFGLQGLLNSSSTDPDYDYIDPSYDLIEGYNENGEEENDSTYGGSIDSYASYSHQPISRISSTASIYSMNIPGSIIFSEPGDYEYNNPIQEEHSDKKAEPEISDEGLGDIAPELPPRNKNTIVLDLVKKEFEALDESSSTDDTPKEEQDKASTLKGPG